MTVPVERLDQLDADWLADALRRPIERLEGVYEGGVEGFAVREAGVVDASRGDTGLARALESERVGAVAEDKLDVDVERAGGDGVDESLQVGAAAGDQYGGARPGGAQR